MNISDLAEELAAGHPDTGAYNADAATAAGELNAVNRTRNRTSMTASEVYNAVDAAEYVALDADEKQEIWDILHLGEINPFGMEATRFTALFGGGSDTITALAAARQALTLDEYSGEAWAALAEAQLYYEYDWEESDQSFKRALQLAPSLDHAHAHYAYLLSLLGQWDEVFNHAEKARELSPLDPTWTFFAGWLYMVQEEFDRAEELMLESLELSPNFPFGLYGLGDLYKMQGSIEKAVELHERIPADNPLRNWALGPTYAAAGREVDALNVAAEMSVNPGPKDKLFLAFTYSALGDFDEAMRWFESSYETRVDWLPWIVLEQSYGGYLEEIRKDRRFQSLIERLGF